MPHSFEEVCGAVARGWCAPANTGKEMDADLATAIAKEVWKLMCNPPEPLRRTLREGWHYDSKGYCDNPGRGY